jgi:hypothetical protein
MQYGKILLEMKTLLGLPYVEKTTEEMTAELKAAGWEPGNKLGTVWISPRGGLYRGPAAAWFVMTGSNQGIALATAQLARPLHGGKDDV